MPRIARIKSPLAMYHIMSRSISETDLFKNDSDKNFYLQLVKRYKEIFLFKVYAFCLMSNHTHFLIDSNGADISKFMHCINQCYSQYYNKKYSRKGPLFADRFKSKIAHTDISVICISSYIHNNPKDIKGYKNCVENYQYSSFGIYLGKYKDSQGLLDKDFILKYFNSDPILAIPKYLRFTKSRLGLKADEVNVEELEFNNEYNYTSYKYPLFEGITPNDITSIISNLYGFSKSDLHIKYNHKSSDFRAICILVMRNLCDLKLSEICNYIGNASLSSISYLCSKGYNLTKNEPRYNLLLEDIISNYKINNFNIRKT